MNFWKGDSSLVLGSASPRRREILQSIGVRHVVHVASVDESVLPNEAPEGYLARVVAAKLDAVRTTLPETLRTTAEVILVADTSVVLESRILGKPKDGDDACAMIESLGGKSHDVYTRFALGPARLENPTSAIFHEETVRTRVTFRALSHEEVRAYAKTGEGLDKAGAYAIQGIASAFAKRLDGSYSNVVGLPACEVSVALQKLLSSCG